MFKKLLVILLAAVMTMLLATTAFAAEGVMDANTDPASTTKTDETITICLSAEPAYLWGAGAGNVGNEEEIIMHAITDRLVEVNRATNELVPGLASEWEWIDDTHCKFTLRDGVTMTDGSPLTPEDVVYTVGIWMEYAANTDIGRFVSGAEADGDNAVIIEFNTVAPDLLWMLAWGGFGIVSEEEVEAAGGVEAATKNPVFGCGKYKFKEWVTNQYIILERNEDYWDPDYNGYFKEIRITYINDAASRAMNVVSGDIQVAYDMPISMATTYVGNDAVNVIAHTFGQNTRLWYNMGPNAGATADLLVRQAIDKALDFDIIAMVGTSNMGEAVQGYFPVESPYYNETFTKEERAQDIEAAKALLAEAGYADGLELSIVGMQDQQPIFVVIQEQLRQAGINLTINIVDTPQFVEQANGGTYDLIHVGDLVDARYPAIMTFFQQMFIDTFCIGGAKWTTPEIEEGVHAFIEEADEAKAKEIGAELENTWKDLMMFSNTYGEMHAALTAADIKGYNTTERGFVDLTGFYK
jgi:peptide/nickel transport system substrate-binding protein